MRDTWVEVDLAAIAANVRQLRQWAGCALMAVVKADAYGHGAVAVARTAIAAGAGWLGVATAAEALALRGAGIADPILVLGPVPASELDALREARVSVTATGASSLGPPAAGAPLAVHVKVDTGMGRIGVQPRAAPALVESIVRRDDLRWEGIFTHFSSADTDDAYTHVQTQRLRTVVEGLAERGRTCPWVHSRNSAAILSGQGIGNLARAGIAVYGLGPGNERNRAAQLVPALAWKCRVAQSKLVPAATPISYGRTFVTDRPTRILTLPVGYADGYRREWSSRSHVLVRGRRLPVVGRVTMDQTMVAAPAEVAVAAGEEVVLLGRQGDECVAADELAALSGTIHYEIVSGIRHRVERVYLSADATGVSGPVRRMPSGQ